MYNIVDRDGFKTGRTALNWASGYKSVGNIYTQSLASYWLAAVCVQRNTC